MFIVRIVGLLLELLQGVAFVAERLLYSTREGSAWGVAGVVVWNEGRRF